MDLELQYKSLVESLKLLTASYDKQVRSLPDFVEIQDEVVAAFGDAFLLLPQLIENDFLSKTAIASIIRCFNLLDMAIRNEETANIEAFKAHDTWLKVRQLAGKALEDMKEQKGEPDLSHLDWID